MNAKLRINVVTGFDVEWLFADLLERLARMLDERCEFLRSHKPVPANECDVYHYYRPQFAVEVDDLSRAVLTNHGFVCRGVPPRQAYGDDVMAAFRRAAVTISQNSIDEELMVQGGVPRDGIVRIRYAVDPDVFTLRPLHDPNGKLVIGIVGRPYGPPDDETTGQEQKGRATLRAIMRGLRPWAERIEWLFLGDLWDEELELGRQSGYDVEFVRRSDVRYPEDFVAAYHRMDVYLVTSRAEGGPASLPEAMACGVWPVCTRVGMCVDLIDEPIGGDLYPINDTARAVELLDSLLDVDARCWLGANRQSVRSAVVDWTWNEWAEGHRIVYERIARA